MSVAAVAAAVACLSIAGSVRAEPGCRPGQAPDVVRVQLGGACGNPERVVLRRNGDDNSRVVGVRQPDGSWLLPRFTDAMSSVTFCSNVCEKASACASANPVLEYKDGRRVCVAEYKFECDESAWTLAIQADPKATLAYTRKREASRQTGEVKAVRAPLKPAEICDLAVDETIEIVPRTNANYSFKPIPVTLEELSRKKRQEWPIGHSALIKFVRLPDGGRSRALTEAERAYFQLDIRELKLTVGGEKPAGTR